MSPAAASSDFRATVTGLLGGGRDPDSPPAGGFRLLNEHNFDRMNN
jgi:hypothetical protein